jgi:GH43 family beta-xylosidase
MNKKTITLVILTLALGMIGSTNLAPLPVFDNPIAEKRADPWVYRTDDGMYYLVATVPAYDRIVIRKAATINGLKTAEEKVLWTKHPSGVMSHHIWAPELHFVDGKWYIYFAAGEAEDVWKIRMWALSNASEDPMEGAWTEAGQITTARRSFSLDATTFEHQGKRYLIWAQAIVEGESGTSLILSEMENPTTLKGPEVVLTNPEYSWERRKYHVNEGPAILKRNGKIFLTYSASATNQHYCLGMLWIEEDADLLDPRNWHKSPAPVFSSNPQVNRFGPGHNSFTVAEDGETVVMIYHARDYEDIEGHELGDPNRATRARTISWTPSGFPDFRQHESD